MSYFKHHVFFCCNQRGEGETCCNNAGATAAQTYAKDRIGELRLKGVGKVRINRPAASTAATADRCWWSIRKTSGTATSTTKTSRKSSRSTWSTGASSTACASERAMRFWR
jgi:hypothetical protein